MWEVRVLPGGGSRGDAFAAGARFHADGGGVMAVSPKLSVRVEDWVEEVMSAVSSLAEIGLDRGVWRRREDARAWALETARPFVQGGIVVEAKGLEDERRTKRVVR